MVELFDKDRGLGGFCRDLRLLDIEIGYLWNVGFPEVKCAGAFCYFYLKLFSTGQNL